MNIQYKIHDGIDHVFDEKGNTFLALRKISWGDSDKPKLDLRKWYVSKEGEETVGKGFSFLTEDGPNELTNILTQCGFGETKTIIDNIKDREDFESSLLKSLGKEKLEELGIEIDEDVADEDYYDPRAIFE